MRVGRDREAERRAMLEAIIADPSASHADRLRADERLQELELMQAARAPNEDLSEADRWQLLEAFGMPGALAIARGPEAVQPPVDERDHEEIIRLQAQLLERLEERVAELQTALQRAQAGRALPPGKPLELRS